ncbi:MAG: glycosyltransferase family 4 protein [Chloroflexota bacterium]
MKILLISHFFPPTHNAGAEKRTLGYALSLLGLNHEVQVVCADQWEEGKKYWNGYVDEIYQNIPVRRIHLNWKLAPDPNRYLYNNPVVEQHLRKWLTEWKPDIVHITSCLTLSASVINAAKDQNVPIVLTLTDFWFICPRVNLIRQDASLCDGKTTPWECLDCMFGHSRIYKGLTRLLPANATHSFVSLISKQPLITRLRGFRGKMCDMEDRKRFLSDVLKKVDYITAPSRSLRDIIKASGVTQSIEVVHSGHDLSWLKTKPNARKKNGMITVGYIGQIVHLKGVHVLVSAFINAGIHESMNLVIYGSTDKAPEYMAVLNDIIKGKPEIAVEFSGEFPHEQLGMILSALDVLVVPSLWMENNPRVIQEAFASGVPVIASNVGGISEFVHHEKNGLLFERGNIGDLVVQFQRLVAEPDLLERLRSGIPKVKTITDEIGELEKLYFELTRVVEPQ